MGARKETEGKSDIMLFNNHKIKMASKPGKTQKENPVGCTEESKR